MIRTKPKLVSKWSVEDSVYTTNFTIPAQTILTVWCSTAVLKKTCFRPETTQWSLCSPMMLLFRSSFLSCPPKSSVVLQWPRCPQMASMFPYDPAVPKWSHCSWRTRYLKSPVSPSGPNVPNCIAVEFNIETFGWYDLYLFVFMVTFIFITPSSTLLNSSLHIAIA